MRKLWAVVAVVCVLLCGCDKQSDTAVIVEADNSYSVICDGYSDTNSIEIAVSESAEVTVTVSIKASGGSLSIEALGSDGSAVYHGADITSNCTATIKLLGPDTYVISVTGNKFSGRCSLDWETIGAVANSQALPEVSVINPTATKSG